MKALFLIGLLGASACLWMLVLCLSILAGAVELYVTGSFVGIGNQSLFFTGDNLSAFWNGTNLRVSAVAP